MGRRRKDRPDPVPRQDVASLGDDRHDAGPEAWPGRAAFQAFLQSGLEAIDQDAGRAESGEFERRRGAELKDRAQRKALEVEPDRRDRAADPEREATLVKFPQFCYTIRSANLLLKRELGKSHKSWGPSQQVAASWHSS